MAKIVERATVTAQVQLVISEGEARALDAMAGYGCANCYADAQASRNPKTLGIWGPNGTRVVASEAMWREPLKWNREAGQQREAWAEDREERESLTFPGRPARPRVFCASLADVFEDWKQEIRTTSGMVLHQCADGHLLGLESVFANGCDCIHGCERIARPATLDDVRARLFRLIDATPNLDWLLLTKRPENVRRMTHDAWTEKVVGHVSQNEGDGRRWKRRENVWLGTSIACQEDADRNIPELLKCIDLCAKTFLSIEPLIEPVDIWPWFAEDHPCSPDWVIVGGESGPNARPCNIEWIRSIVRQCRDAGVPCFVKQLGAEVLDGDPVSRCSWPGLTQFHQRSEWCRVLLRDPKGGDPTEWPEDVRVREVPG